MHEIINLYMTFLNLHGSIVPRSYSPNLDDDYRTR